MLKLYIALIIINATCCLILGLYIFLINIKNKINKLFFYHTITILPLILSPVLIQIFENVILINFLYYFYFSLIVVFFIIQVNFYLNFTKQEINKYFKMIYILFSILLISMIFIFRINLFSIAKVYGIWKYKFSNILFWYFLFSPAIIFLELLTIFILYKFYKTTVLKKEKKQSGVIIITIIIAFSSAYSTDFILPNFDFYKMPSLIPLFFAVYLYGIFYALIKYQFLRFDFSFMTNEILSNINEMIILFNPKKIIIEVNTFCNKIISNNLMNENFYDVVLRDDELFKNIDDLIQGKINSFKNRITYKSNPENITTDTYLSSLKDKFDDFVGVLVISKENPGIKQFAKLYKLSTRQMDIILLSIDGLSNEEIGQKLNLSRRTVESHFSNIYNKLSINNKVELIKLTNKFNLI